MLNPYDPDPWPPGHFNNDRDPDDLAPARGIVMAILAALLTVFIIWAGFQLAGSSSNQQTSETTYSTD